MPLWIMITGLILFLIIFLLIAPITIIFSGNWVDDQKSGFMKLYWANPQILKIIFDINKKTIGISLFKFIKFVKPLESDTENYPKKSEPHDSLPKNTNGLHHEDIPLNKKENRSLPEASPEKNTNNTAEQDSKHNRTTFKDRIVELIEKSKRAAYRLVFFSGQQTLYIKLLSCIKRSVEGMLRIFSIHSYSINVRAGLDEPSETGRLFGYWTGVANAFGLNNNGKKRILVEPVFNKECIEISGSLILKTSIMRITAPVAIVAFTFPYISTYRVWQANKNLFKNQKSRGKK